MFSFMRASEKNGAGEVDVVVEPVSAPVPIAMFARNCATWNG
jgi:hypothetical protein